MSAGPTQGGRAGAAIAIVAVSIGAAVVYGVLHDQVTARVCVEYFTIGHPPVFKTTDPTLLGLGWGVIATWWVGLILGIPMACAALGGSRPRIAPGSLIRPIGCLLLCMGGCALIAGVLGYAAAEARAVRLVEPIASRVPRERHSAFIADLWSHVASYASGFIGGIVLTGLTWRKRGNLEADARRSASTEPRLNLIVIRTKELAGTRAFYEALGLRFQREQHGSGLEHFAAVQGEQVFELYPATDEQPVSSLRLGFRVHSVRDAIEAAKAAGASVAREPQDSPDGEQRAILLDPDGRKVELSGGR